jgi:broad specificity phosphatase PhoE
MTKIILTRHGHVEGIQPERFRGRAELPLTPLGDSQASAVAARIAASWKPAAIYTSPMGRCVETATHIAQACKASFQVMNELNDLDYGSWQGRLLSEMQASDPKLLDDWKRTPHLVRFPGGESLQDMAARTADAIRLTLQRHPDALVVAVGHDNVNRVLLTQLLDQPLSAFWRIAQTPCCLNEIDIVDGAVRVLRINDTNHLPTTG